MADFTGRTILYSGAAGGLGLRTTVHVPAGRRTSDCDRQRPRQDRCARRGRRQPCGPPGGRPARPVRPRRSPKRPRRAARSRSAASTSSSTTRRSTRRSRSRISRSRTTRPSSASMSMRHRRAVQVALPHMRQAGVGPDHQHLERHLLWRLGPLLSPYVAVEGGADRPHPGVGARVRSVRHHRQRDVARRLSDRCREDPSGSRKATPASSSTARRSSDAAIPATSRTR